MKFNSILQKLIYGKKVRRSSWSENVWLESDGDNVYMKANGEIVKHYANTDRVFTLDDVTAEDWEIYK